jgi:hypothetical protein
MPTYDINQLDEHQQTKETIDVTELAEDLKFILQECLKRPALRTLLYKTLPNISLLLASVTEEDLITNLKKKG